MSVKLIYIYVYFLPAYLDVLYILYFIYIYLSILNYIPPGQQLHPGSCMSFISENGDTAVSLATPHNVNNPVTVATLVSQGLDEEKFMF